MIIFIKRIIRIIFFSFFCELNKYKRKNINKFKINENKYKKR